MKLELPIELRVRFVCERCGLTGYTPAMGAASALALTTGRARIRCPQCSHIIQISRDAAAKTGYQELLGRVSQLTKTQAAEHRNPLPNRK